jgi:hypothetical protein
MKFHWLIMVNPLVNPLVNRHVSYQTIEGIRYIYIPLTHPVATVNIGTLPRGERKASWSKVMHSPPAWDLGTDSVCQCMSCVCDHTSWIPSGNLT